jgi:hypothetical protein
MFLSVGVLDPPATRHQARSFSAAAFRALRSLRVAGVNRLEETNLN